MWLKISLTHPVLSFWAALFSFIQVKETGDVVLAGAYVDLHSAAEASPENVAQVCGAEKASFKPLCLFSSYQI